MENRSIKEIIAKNLTELRKNKGLTQIQLAEQFSYSDKAVSKWERGDTTPDVETLQALADFYGVTIDYITHEGKPSEKKQFLAKNEKPERNKPVVAIMFSLIPVLVVMSLYSGIAAATGVNHWPLIIWSMAGFFISAFAFSCAWFDKKTKTSVGVLMTWSILAAIYVTLGMYVADSAGWQSWPMFFLGIPITIGFFLFNLTRKKQKTEENKQ